MDGELEESGASEDEPPNSRSGSLNGKSPNAFVSDGLLTQATQINGSTIMGLALKSDMAADQVPLGMGEAPFTVAQLFKMKEDLNALATRQFITRWPLFQSLQTPEQIWGDEVVLWAGISKQMEFCAVFFEPEIRNVCVFIDAQLIVKNVNINAVPSRVADWKAETCNHQLESSPLEPYPSSYSAFGLMQQQIMARVLEMHQIIGPYGAELLPLSYFPRFGTDQPPNFCFPPAECSRRQEDSLDFSLRVPNECLSIEPFLRACYFNVHQRLRGPMHYFLPKWRDDINPTTSKRWTAREVAEDKDIEFIGCGLGFAACSLQITQQMSNFTETRFIYDQLAVVCPVLLAFCAASPCFIGLLSELDTRWLAYAKAEDDRTPFERGLEGAIPDTPSSKRIHDARVYSIESYISDRGVRFNDLESVYHDASVEALSNAGVPREFAEFLGQQMVKGETMLFPSELATESDFSFYLFHSIQTFNSWSILRLKYPDIEFDHNGDPLINAGWRVEIRPMELHPTPFQNAAVATFVVLLTRAILMYEVDMLYPTSALRDNILKAVRGDAARQASFLWRKLPNLPELPHKRLSRKQPTTTRNDVTNGHVKNRSGTEALPSFVAGANDAVRNQQAVTPPPSSMATSVSVSQLSKAGSVNSISSSDGSENSLLHVTNKRAENGESVTFSPTINSAASKNGGSQPVHKRARLSCADDDDEIVLVADDVAVDTVDSSSVRTVAADEMLLLHDTRGVMTNINGREYRRADDDDADSVQFVYLTLEDIILGCEGKFFGLLPLIEKFIDEVASTSITLVERNQIQAYLEFVRRKAAGEIPTVAQWFRRQYLLHPEYKNDGVVSPPMAFDALSRYKAVASGLVDDEPISDPVIRAPLSPSASPCFL